MKRCGEKYGTVTEVADDNIIRRMRFTCWITKATHTKYNYCSATATIVTPARLIVTLYVHLVIYVLFLYTQFSLTRGFRRIVLPPSSGSCSLTLKMEADVRIY